MNRKISTWEVVLLILLVLVVSGAVSLGAVLRGILYIIGGILLLGFIVTLLFGNRLRQMSKNGRQQRQEQSRPRRPEGEVTVEQQPVDEKQVSSTVGEYVEFEEVKEDE